MAGLQTSLKAGADIIVNTDADNQYCADDIPNLIKPILLHQAEIGLSTTNLENETVFPNEKATAKLGSWVNLRLASKNKIPDAPSGFRAFSREAALQLNVQQLHLYLETIIQRGKKQLHQYLIRTNRFYAA